MSRIFIFLVGVAVGALGHFAALNYHVVRAEDGFHVIPKVAAGMGESYVDIRGFGVTDWNEHRPLLEAIVKSDKPGLLRDTAGVSLQNEIHNCTGCPASGPRGKFRLAVIRLPFLS